MLGGGGEVAADGVPVRVVASERSRPEIFCCIFAGRTSRSAWLDVGGMRRSVRNRSTSSRRSFRHSSSSRPGGRFSLLPGTRRTCDSPASTPCRNSFSSFAMLASGMACRPCSRALFAAWMMARRLPGSTGPDRVRVGLGGVLKITKEVGCAELVHDAGELVVVDVPVVYHHGAGQVREHERAEVFIDRSPRK